MKKVEALTKAVEFEPSKVKREATAKEKGATSMKPDDRKNTGSISSSRRSVK